MAIIVKAERIRTKADVDLRVLQAERKQKRAEHHVVKVTTIDGESNLFQLVNKTSNKPMGHMLIGETQNGKRYIALSTMDKPNTIVRVYENGKITETPIPYPLRRIRRKNVDQRTNEKIRTMLQTYSPIRTALRPKQSDNRQQYVDRLLVTTFDAILTQVNENADSITPVQRISLLAIAKTMKANLQARENSIAASVPYEVDDQLSREKSTAVGYKVIHLYAPQNGETVDINFHPSNSTPIIRTGNFYFAIQDGQLFSIQVNDKHEPMIRKLVTDIATINKMKKLSKRLHTAVIGFEDPELFDMSEKVDLLYNLTTFAESTYLVRDPHFMTRRSTADSSASETKTNSHAQFGTIFKQIPTPDSDPAIPAAVANGASQEDLLESISMWIR